MCSYKVVSWLCIALSLSCYYKGTIFLPEFQRNRKWISKYYQKPKCSILENLLEARNKDFTSCALDERCNVVDNAAQSFQHFDKIMPEKKTHEVELMSNLVNNLCHENEADFLIDLGGYFYFSLKADTKDEIMSYWNCWYFLSLRCNYIRNFDFILFVFLTPSWA